MAYTTINKSTDYFNTKLYTGNQSTQNITGVGFQPDWVWIKQRADDNYSHELFDAIRGVTKYMSSNETNAEATGATTLTAFDSDGFTLGSDTIVNKSGKTLVAWNWKAGTTGSGNTTGAGTAKSYSYSVNTTAGFSIVKYTGNGTSGQQIPHHLGAVPKMIIQKRLTSGAGWNTYHHALGLNYMMLNVNNAEASDSGKYNANPTSTYVQIGNDGGMNSNDVEHMLYCFAEKTGYSKFGNYSGNGNVDGNFLYTGFKPAFLMVKRYDTSGNWVMFDNKRSSTGGNNEINYALLADSNSSESTGTSSNDVDFLSNGIKIREDNGDLNTNGGAYIYMAFASAPLVGTNNIPATGR